jgi:hypothetical protein
MAPYYDESCKEFNWPCDAALLKKMKDANTAEIKKLEDSIADAEKNLAELQ